MEQFRQLMYCGEGETGHCTFASSAAAAKSLQSCPTLCDPIDSSPPGSSVPGILQARIQEWVAISFSNAWKWKVKVKSFSRARPFTTPWTAAHQAPPSMGFSASSTPCKWELSACWSPTVSHTLGFTRKLTWLEGSLWLPPQDVVFFLC